MNIKRFFINLNNIEDNIVHIDGTEHHHLKNVLRLEVGNEILVITGNEFYYFCKILNITKNETTAQIVRKEVCLANPKTNVTVFQALIKKDNMELVVQKLNELGVSNFIPFESEFTTVKDKISKQNKLQNIANQSCKQCLRSKPMAVLNCLPFSEVLKQLNNYDIILFANELENSKPFENYLTSNQNKNVAIIIGSEGGFSKTECKQLINNNAISFSLGKRILRAETASIAVCAMVMFLLGEYSL